MSCNQTTQAYEAASDAFFDLMNADNAFHGLIYEYLLKPIDQWKEKEFGWNEYPYENAFDHLWQWDCEGMQNDMVGTVKKYIEKVCYDLISEEACNAP